MTTKTNVCLLGAGAGAASLATMLNLQQRDPNIDMTAITREISVGETWSNRYAGLRLHTTKGSSRLHPRYPMAQDVDQYPTRDQYVEYLTQTVTRSGLTDKIRFSEEIQEVAHRPDNLEYPWLVILASKVHIEAKVLVDGTGLIKSPRPFLDEWENLARVNRKLEQPSDALTLLHSHQVSDFSGFSNKKVLVIGGGNTARDMAISSQDAGATVTMSVRSGVHVVPRDLVKIFPVTSVASILSKVIPWPAAQDWLSIMLLLPTRWQQDRVGLPRPEKMVMTQVAEQEQVPIIDYKVAGRTLLDRLQDHSIQLHTQGIKGFSDDGKIVVFADGREEAFDVVIACIGYDSRNDLLPNDVHQKTLHINRKHSRDGFHPQYALGFNGFTISPTGLLFDIATEAKKLARAIHQHLRQPAPNQVLSQPGNPYTVPLLKNQQPGGVKAHAEGCSHGMM